MSAPKWPPVPKLHRPSGQDRVRWRGAEYYLGPTGSAESRRRYAALLAELAGRESRSALPEAVPGPAPDPTVAEVALAWELRERPRYAGSDEGERVARALGYLTAECGSSPAAAVDAMVLGQARTRMIAADLAASTINREVSRIQRVWRWAEGQRLLPRGSWANLRTLGPIRRNDGRVRHTERRRAATWEEVERVTACSAPPLAAALLVQWWTGCRSQDARWMRAGEVARTQEGSGEPLEVWIYRPGSHKTAYLGHERDVLIGPKAQEVLHPWLEGKEPADWVFPTHPGVRRSSRVDWFHGERCYSQQSYSKAVERAALRAGLKGWCSYMCRHAAKRRVTRAYSLDHARSFLGQASLSSTDHYSHERDLDMAREVARTLG